MLVKHYTVDFKICFFILFMMLHFSNVDFLTAQSAVKNGSFEKHKSSVYPKEITGSLWYKESDLLKCIGFGAIQPPTPFDWPPVGSPCYFNF